VFGRGLAALMSGTLASCSISTGRPLYENCRMGECSALFIHERRSLGDGRWRFRTRSVIRSDPGSSLWQGWHGRTRMTLGEWSEADCLRSTIDHLLVSAIARSGVERGKPELIRSICNTPQP
jgi:hypothetical protein